MAANYLVLYQKNSGVVTLAGLQDQLSGAYINNADATATLTDRAGNEIDGLTAVDGVYLSGTNGDYEFPIDPDLFSPKAGGGYTLTVVAVSPSNAQYFVERPAVVKVRNRGTEV